MRYLHSNDPIQKTRAGLGHVEYTAHAQQHYLLILIDANQEYIVSERSKSRSWDR